ncbi:MAG: Gfo/Idh/MocA family oxidoreductase [Candidatus Omnitrophica bacterium]|nr:Gfo/Idh/MocA family oxidoreductase [Candidatus Omnitrophota bacterium]
MLNVGVIGYGYWGPNIVRNFMALDQTDVGMVCDLNAAVLKKVKSLYPTIEVTQDYKEVLRSAKIDIVAVVTPVSSHYELAKAALESGKHVFIEKPFTATSKQAQDLVELAEKKNLKIMVDHTFIFTGAVRKIKEMIDDGVLGDLYYYDSTRVSLGLFQKDVNVIWDLAPHDFSIIDYLISHQPESLTAQGVDHVKSGQENIAYITVHYPNNLIVHVNVNWLSPVKVRTTLIGGKKKMLVWDDLQSDEKIKIYDKGVQMDTKEGMYQLLVDYRAGDMYSPRVDHAEALKSELAYFVECIETNETPINDGRAGLRVVKILEKADESLKQKGKLVTF